MNIFNNLKVGNKILIGYFVVLCLIASIVSMLLFNINNLTKSFTFLVEHDQPVLANAHQLQKLVVDMETGERGFLITGKEEYLEPYHNAIKKFETLLKTEKQLVSDNPPQVTRLEKIAQLHDEWIQKAAKPEIAKRHEANKATVTADYLQEMLKGEVGKGILDKIRGILVQMEANLTAKNDLESVILTIKIAKDMVDQETGQRGFIITGAENFLEPYQQGQVQLKTDILALRSRLDKDPENLTLLNQVELLSRQWLEKAGEPEIQARQQMNANPVTIADVSALIQMDTGKNILNTIRAQFKHFLQIEIELNVARSSQVQQNANWVRTLIISLTLGSIILILILGFITSYSITQPLIKITEMANQIAAGHLKQMVENSRTEIQKITHRQDEMGEIGRSYDALANYFRLLIVDIVQVSQQLVQSDKHIIPQAEYRGDFAQIQQALSKAALKLADTTAENTNQNWFKTGQTQLNEKLGGEQNVKHLSKNTIDFLTTYLKATVGLFYLVEQPAQSKQGCLKQIATYAYTQDAKRPDTFLFGEGLVGQAALEQKMLVWTHTPDEYTSIIRSGLSNAVPHHIMIIPYLYENTVKGVIELGFTEEPTLIQQELLAQMMPIIGIAVNTAESRTQMQYLLQKTQTQSQELKIQQEELQQANEELQSQTEELQNQTEELQTQQEELQQTNEALEERTKALENQKAEIQHKNAVLEKTRAEMEQAQIAMKRKAEELELASKYKSEFLANMSHELRTPLNSLLILAQLLVNNKDNNLTDKQIEYAKTIHSAGTDLLTLINDILDLSKVEAGKMDVNIDEVRLTEVVDMIKHKFHHVATEKKLAFQITLAEDVLPVIKTDVQRLQQILNNLLSNAFKFTREGEIRLEIQRAIDKFPLNPKLNSLLSQTGVDFPNPTTIDGAREDIQIIAFRVTDTGIGIPENKQKVIFEAFQQVDGTTSRRFGGTGLGLSIARQLARLLGGEIQLASEEDKGSTFTLFLPANSDTHSNVHSDSQTLNHSEIQAPQMSGSLPTNEIEPMPEIPALADDRDNWQADDKTLLIIEDDRKFANILMELAHEKQFKCLLAEDGQIGLQLAQQYKPRAIILDIGLPQVDGWTVMDSLKDDPNTRHIPVHFMSASDHVHEAKQMGAIGYLLKPVGMDELGDAFKNIEQFISKTVKNVLVIADDEQHYQKIVDLIRNEEVQITQTKTQVEVLQHLQINRFDCIILDIDLEQSSGINFLEQMKKRFHQIPLIVYAERELTPIEERFLLQCEDYLTIKTVSSPERLLDEATLFLHQIEAKLSSTQRQMLQRAHDKAAIFRDKKVLIVDDDMRNVFALTMVLESKNMEVIIGDNGNEALELLDKHGKDIAIVLMDIMMPEMDGYEAMRQIRKSPQFRKLPIIALTAKAMKGDKAKCIEAGANDYLSKPVDTDKLISLMRVWLYR